MAFCLADRSKLKLDSWLYVQFWQKHYCVSQNCSMISTYKNPDTFQKEQKEKETNQKNRKQRKRPDSTTNTFGCVFRGERKQLKPPQEWIMNHDSSNLWDTIQLCIAVDARKILPESDSWLGLKKENTTPWSISGGSKDAFEWDGSADGCFLFFRLWIMSQL